MSREPAPVGAEVCGAVNSVYGYVCEREAGHDGVHIEFGDTRTVAWNALLPRETT